jgi:hypothetical protein
MAIAVARVAWERFVGHGCVSFCKQSEHASAILGPQHAHARWSAMMRIAPFGAGEGMAPMAPGIFTLQEIVQITTAVGKGHGQDARDTN